MSERVLRPIVESYNVDEEYLYCKTYIFIKGTANGRNFKYTLKALPLARKIHNGQYRKGLVDFDGKKISLPFIAHPLKVCSTLVALNLPMSDEALDILYTCAILHDVLEDGSKYFPKGGIELTQDYGFPPIVEETIKLLSKHSGADEYELNEYFNGIKDNVYAILVKIADRSHNVEDLYNMKNIPKYIKETRDYFISKYGICAYAKAHYPELSNGITILKSKIVSLTEATETILEMQQVLIDEKDETIRQKEEEIEKLKKELYELKKNS